MKIFSPKIIKKPHNSKMDPTLRKILNSPKGPKLRSRKILYAEKQKPLQVPQDNFEEQQIPQQKTLKKQKPIKKNHKRKLQKQEGLDEGLIEQLRSVSIDESESDQGSESEHQGNPQEQIKNRPIRKKRESRPFPIKKILSCNHFKKVKQIDFLIYFKILAKAKMFSTLIVNEYGQVIFADRLGSEHFEGSLNNFARNPIYSMILECKLQEFFQKVQSIKNDECKILKLLIYSKNSKRRYSKSSNQISLTNQDLFNRYLKCISCQIIPIEIVFSTTEQFEGFWNNKLFQINKPLKCFLFKSRLSKSLPNLQDLDLNSDKKIDKFLKYTLKKQSQKDKVKLQHQHSENQFAESKLEQDGIQGFLQNQLSNEKEIENIYNQMNDDNKHSKSTLTRGFLLNSGEGKLRNCFD